MDTEKTLVVFRKFKDGAVIALFPEFINYPDGACESYMRIGQHGAADYNGLLSITKLATPKEYASLKRELESGPYGYNLKVRRKFTRARTLSDDQFKRIVSDMVNL